MTNLYNDCRPSCTGIAVVASIILGIIAAFLSFFAIITITPAFLWVLLGIAVGFLGITLLTSANCCNQRNNCRQILGLFLTGIIGTVVTSVILLGITFAATSVIGAIVTGFLIFFFFLVLTIAACLIKCRYNNN